MTWAAEAFRLTTSSVKNETQIHTHMCYSNFEDIVDTINDLDADVITIEHSRSHGGFLDYLKNHPYLKGLGLGVYDIHSLVCRQLKKCTILSLMRLPSVRLTASG